MPLPSTSNVSHSFPPPIVRGDDYVLVLRFTAKRAGRKLKSKVSMAGATFRSQIRPTFDSATVTATFTVQLLPGGEEHEVELSLTDSVTAPLAPGTYDWDLEVTKDGDTTTYFQGYQIEVLGDVSRS